MLAVPPLEEVDPPQAACELARRANDEMADLVRRFPERFTGFAAALPLGDVEASLTEIDHAVGELGALGVQLLTNVRGAPLDHRRFDPILARMEALDRMVWLHPTRSAAWPDYATERGSDFGIWWSLGWPYETAAALSRLVYSDQMDRHPRLRVIADHGGGMVPHFSARLAMGPGYRQTKERLPLPPLDYLIEHPEEVRGVGQEPTGALHAMLLHAITISAASAPVAGIVVSQASPICRTIPQCTCRQRRRPTPIPTIEEATT